MVKRDYYEVLGIGRDASDVDIKKAFRQKAKECHPDINQGDDTAEHLFKEVNEAYEILSDNNKRQQYDQFGHAAFDGTGGASGFGGFGGGFEDIFDTIFSGGFGGRSSGRRRNGPTRGRDIRYDLSITFEEAAFGIKKELEFTRIESCSECDGTGAKKDSDIITCVACNGAGQVQQTQNTPFGRFVNVVECSSCNGTGRIIVEKCDKCKGDGRLRKKHKMSINIPAGIDDGQILSVSGEGEAGTRGGPPGDLRVVIMVKPHKLFERRNYDLFLEMPVSFTRVTLGGEIEVPTLDDRIRYKVPAGTQTGTTFRIRGKGIKHLHHKGYGDLYVKVNVETPKKLTEDQLEALEAFEKSMSSKADSEQSKNTKKDKADSEQHNKNAKKDKGILDKVKDAFH